MRRSLMVAASVSLVCGLLAGCGDSGGEDAPPSSQVSTEAIEDRSNVEADEVDFDSGDYRTTPLNVDNADENPDIGFTIEKVRYGDHLLLPHEVDPRLPKAGRGGPQMSAGGIGLYLTEGHKEAVERVADQFIGGFFVTGNDDAEILSARNAVLRFDNPDVAKQVAQAFADADRAMGRPLDSNGPAEPGAAVEVPGHPEVLATQLDSALAAVTSWNEFVLYTEATNARWLADSENELANDTAWQIAYAQRFFERQLPAMEEITTLKTKDGFGTSDTPQPLDPGEALKFSVVDMGEERDKMIIPVGVNARNAAGRFVSSKAMHDIFLEAGVDTVGLNQSNVVRAQDVHSAENLAEAVYQLNLSQDFKEYQEPQGIPNTRCIERDEPGGTTFICYLQHGRYVAISQRNERSDKLTDDDIRYDLSQIMAAQYKLFEHVPKT